MLRFVSSAVVVAGALLTASTALPCQGSPSRRRAAERAVDAKVISITVTDDGFSSAAIPVKKGEPLKLVFTRTSEKICATEMVITGQRIHRMLPLNKPVEVFFTPQKAGKVRCACGKEMVAELLRVQE